MGGYLFKFTDYLSIGPTGGIGQTTVSFPSITESSILPTALALQANTFYSAQTQIGVKARIKIYTKFMLDMQALWNQELLDTTLFQEASLAAYAGTYFATGNPMLPDQTLSLQAQIAYEITPQFTLAARGAKTLRSGINMSLGQLSLLWRF